MMEATEQVTGNISSKTASLGLFVLSIQNVAKHLSKAQVIWILNYFHMLE
jgi:hypothetical protein